MNSLELADAGGVSPPLVRTRPGLRAGGGLLGAPALLAITSVALLLGAPASSGMRGGPSCSSRRSNASHGTGCV
jgi:hypothetical protein